MYILNQIWKPIPHSSFQYKSEQIPGDGRLITKWDINKSCPFFFMNLANSMACEGGGETGSQHVSHFALQFPIKTFFNPKTHPARYAKN